jgi:methionyl-tRNA formyltransferase
VKEFALGCGLNVVQPEKVSSPDSVEGIAALVPEVLVVAAYGQILRQALLDVPSRGSLNVHASLLPRHRGASPIAAAILAGDDFTGVTIMEVVRALDAGPMVARVTEASRDDDTSGSLEARLADAGGHLLGEVLEPWAKGEIAVQPQDDGLSTYAPMLKREEARIDWNMPASELWRRVRAFNPWPLAYTTWKETEIRILEASVASSAASLSAGSVVVTESGRPAVQTANGLLVLEKVQMAGRKVVSGPEFLRGQPGFAGATL